MDKGVALGRKRLFWRKTALKTQFVCVHKDTTRKRTQNMSGRWCKSHGVKTRGDHGGSHCVQRRAGEKRLFWRKTALKHNSCVCTRTRHENGLKTCPGGGFGADGHKETQLRYDERAKMAEPRTTDGGQQRNGDNTKRATTAGWCCKERGCSWWGVGR
ncbi:unnamed protein product [Macrosiphum euphorbiae]|uniref:Uncharacterized protein n=1 Tax=Macrosiphum euphorbiae TaxID=13131 RepID=A0AAV0WSC7_9HEMI|nr:unnamed protein product [Macrosiphum euphorbiae]